MTAELRCSQTGRRYAATPDRWRSDDGAPLDLVFEPRFHPDRIDANAPSLWRYRAALPIDDPRGIVSLGEGRTPLVETTLFGRPVALKLDHLAPTGSFKDRGATVLISHARVLGVTRLVEDSSGNAGAAIAAYAAAAGIAAEVFVPAATSSAKTAQISAVGARVRAIAGDREDVARACQAAAADAFYASHVWQPHFLHGTKTIVYEILEQRGWQAPDAIIVPAGNGTLLLGCALGLDEMATAGLIDKLPRLIAVQAACCAPLFEAWQRGAEQPGATEAQPTVAEGIAIANPPRGAQCLEAIRRTDGFVVAVSEAQIVAAWREVADRGLLIEPTAAAALAGWVASDLGGDVVVPLTGHGLKAADKLAQMREVRP